MAATPRKATLYSFTITGYSYWCGFHNSLSTGNDSNSRVFFNSFFYRYRFTSRCNRVLSDEASATSNSSMDTSSSSVSTPTSIFSSPEEVLEATLTSIELMFAVKSSAPETVSTAPTSASSLSISSATAPDGSLLDDELSKSS